MKMFSAFSYCRKKNINNDFFVLAILATYSDEKKIAESCKQIIFKIYAYFLNQKNKK